MPLPSHTRALWLPWGIMAATCALSALFLPYFPVDETRYLGVAWEMRVYDSLAVPLQNGLPYSHKPPLLFWLLNLDWRVFGVNEATLRFIPLLFGLACVWLTHRIALELWGREDTARNAALVLSATLPFLLWSSCIMFDVVLSAWVLLALLGIVAQARQESLRTAIATGLALGMGILTKGPVLLVYLLPVALLAFLWTPRQGFSRRWYGWLAVSLLTGVALVLLWLLPAASAGGAGYRRAILWGQTADRVANSFAHKRPAWWYLPWLPLMLLPWTLFAPAWRCTRGLLGDPGYRMLLLWAGGTLTLFSLISGKQLHYLVTALPAFSLLMAKQMESGPAGERGRWHLPVALFHLLLGGTLLALPHLAGVRLVRQLVPGEVRAAGVLLLTTALFLLCTGRLPLARSVRYTALSSLALFVAVLIGGNTFFGRYDLRGIAGAVRAKQEAGFNVMHLGKYHGQFHFAGRLTRPLIQVEDGGAVRDGLAWGEKVALITYEPGEARIDPSEVYFRQPFRSKEVVLWNRKGIERFLAGAGK